jgi:hypothetical protein
MKLKKNYCLVFCILVLVAPLCTFFLPENNTFCQAKQYARITKSNIAFYKEPFVSNDNILFYPEITYFVELIAPEENSFYKARYMDIDGYVLASDLVFVSGQPQNPFPENIGLKILSSNGLNLRSSPIASQGPFNILCTLPFLESNIKYIAKTFGEEYAPAMGDTWYYCTYITGQENISGYLYSVYCYPLANIPRNMEELQTVDKPYFSEESTVTQTNNVDKLSSLPMPVQILLVAVVCLPCILIVWLLFKPTHLSVDNGKGKTKKIKRLKKSDYYELDD